MISEAESLSCGVHIPKDMLPGWSPPESSWVHDSSMLHNNTCSSRAGREWLAQFFRTKPVSSRCYLQLMRQYLNINYTHVLGEPCSSTEHVALHVRSGDVVRGDFSEDGTYRPQPVYPGRGLHPTAFYISVIPETRKRRGREVPFFVFCETMGNPTCEYFEKLSLLEENVVLKVGQPLIDDLRLMMCASEVAESRGTFSNAFELSPKPQIRHTFSDKPWNGDKLRLHVIHWITSSEQAVMYTKLMKVWNNTGFQRHEVDAAYEISHTSLETS